MRKPVTALLSVRGVLAAVFVAGGIVPAAAASGANGQPPCTTPDAGGEWSSYGQSLMGQERQRAEKTIGTDNVGQLHEVWRSDTTVVQSAPPIVAGGCVFLNASGAIEARDLRTGALVWRQPSIDTSDTFAPTVADGRVHLAFVQDGQPRAAALDQSTGRVLWTSEPVYFGYP